MAIDKVSISNQALTEIGVGAITSLEEDSEAAFQTRLVFDQLLEEELERGNWSFATYRAELAAEITPPAFGWAYSHPLPSNPYCLRVISIEDDPEHILEGRKILSDETPLQIRYIGRVTDMAQLSGLFRQAFAYRLAKALAIPLRGSGDLRDRMNKEYVEALAIAASKDSQQGTPPEQDEGSWALSRGGV
jgi:hypothetical protein